MNLNRRITEYDAGKEILASPSNAAYRAVTLNASKFTPGIVQAGQTLTINTTTGKAEPWVDGSTGEAVLLGRTVRVNVGEDVVETALEAGIVFEAKCVGVTAEFKEKCKFIKFR
ncbi:hypothetical protein [Bacillus sp. CGMCC 1.16541]|uniref:hypothetical protein n=1 Tax=Bacillus sp. CGMCC 1.16541 TaxID=2185143 RepID=UPI000D72C97C|nr:hypothetical protein [Bacillus sp. CGMCC 1.16541]